MIINTVTKKTIIASTTTKTNQGLSKVITGSDIKSTLLYVEIKGVLWVMWPLSSELSVSARDDILI